MNQSSVSEAIVAIVLAVLLIGVGSVYTDTGDTAPDLRASTYVNDRSGLRATYLFLEQLGVEVTRLEDPILADSDPDRTIVLAAPSVPLTENEVMDLLEWTRSGGRLVVIGSLLSQSHSRLFTAAGYRPGGGPPEAETLAATEDWQAWKGLELIAWPAPSAIAPLATTTTDPFLGDAKALLEGNTGPIALRRAMGEGEILLVSEARGFSNERLRDGDNALVAAGLLLGEAGTDARIAFDEFHHGFRASGARTALGTALVERLTSTWPGRALLVLVVAGLVYLAGAAVRFGVAAPGDPPRRRRLSEHADALGRLLEASRSGREAMGLLAAGVRRTVGPRVGLPPALPPIRFRERLGRSETPGAKELAQALEKAESPQAARPREFARIARSLARARRRFIHGRS